MYKELKFGKKQSVFGKRVVRRQLYTYNRGEERSHQFF